MGEKTELRGGYDSLDLGGDYSIIEAKVPVKYIGKTVGDVGFRKNYNVVVLTTLSICEESSAIGGTKRVTNIHGVARLSSVLNEGDIIVMYGKKKDLEALLK